MLVKTSFVFGRPHQFLYAMVVEGRAADTTIRFPLCQVTVTVVNFTLDWSWHPHSPFGDSQTALFLAFVARLDFEAIYDTT
jgi:hypothetical protein